MHASIVIPVWNGSAVIKDCLEAIYTNSGEELHEVICVDNASIDNSVKLIVETFPQVRLLQQPINLGFAGGVNLGMEAAHGDVFILLNQDCIIQPGWLQALLQALEAYPQYGILGSTIYNPDGTLNHTGARIQHPDAAGLHLTDWGDGQVKKVEYVTGAAVAIRREVFNVVGQFDEGYYPAYYEDGDYCYRARCKGIEIAWVPHAQVKHLFSNQEWRVDPIKHTTDGYASRYRFVSKHFEIDEITQFFEAEEAALKDIHYLDHVIGRSIAARQTLRNLTAILNLRQLELNKTPSFVRTRLLQVGFTRILQSAYRTARALTLSTTTGKNPKSLNEGGSPGAEGFFGDWQAVLEEVQGLRQRQEELLNRIYFRSINDPGPETSIQRFSRLLFKRLPSLISGREHFLLTELNALHITRMVQIEEQLKLLEILMEYEYR